MITFRQSSMRSYLVRPLYVYSVVAALLASCSPPKAERSLTSVDRGAIRALDSTFVQGWLRDDTVAVLSVFHPDAVLLPPASAPVSGLAALRSYWWPTDGSHTRITGFDRRIDEISGVKELAFIRGTGTLTWDYQKGKVTQHQTTR